jgi:hypothetical protein
VLGLIEQRLVDRTGVNSVATNARTGSVLVTYDHHRLTRDDMVAMLYDVGTVVRSALGAEELPEDLGRDHTGESSTATGLIGALTDLDARVSAVTGGRVDVKLLVPAGLGLVAVRQIMSNGLGLAEVPGYLLLWLTFDVFYKLHRRRSATVVEAPTVEVAPEPSPATAARNGPANAVPAPSEPRASRRRPGSADRSGAANG